MNKEILSRSNQSRTSIQNPRNVLLSLGSLFIMLIVWTPVAHFLMQGIDPAWIFSDKPLAYFILSDIPYLFIIGMSLLLVFSRYLPHLPQWYSQRIGWAHVDARGARWVISTVCLFIAYHYFASDVNLYANKLWIVDRCLLVVTAILVYIHPAFIFPFVIYAINYNLQFKIPLGHNSYHHIFFAFEFLILIGVFLFLKIFSKRFEFWQVVILGVCLVGSIYFASGYGKLFYVSDSKFQWIFDNHTVHIVAGAYKAHHWLAFLPEDTILALLSVIDKVDIFLNIFTLIAELGIALAFFFNRRVTVFFLVCIILFHTGVFLTTGLLFRMWLLVDIAYLILIVIQPVNSPLLSKMYRLPVSLFAFLIMVTGALLPHTGVYAWWDTGVFYNLDFEVTTVKGQRYDLPRSFLLPYEELNKGNATYYVDRIVPDTNSVGSGSYKFWMTIADLKDPRQIAEGITENGTRHYTPENHQHLEDLIVRSLAHYNQRGLTKDFLSFLPQIPPHYGHMPDPNADYYAGQSPIETVHVSFRVDYYNQKENTFYLIEKEEIYVIPIPEKLN